MKLFESSPSLTMHNVTIVTRVRRPVQQEKKTNQKFYGGKLISTSKSLNKSNTRKSNSTSKNKYIRNPVD